MDLPGGQTPKGTYPDSYYAATASALEPFPALAQGIDTDVCVIGAGYTGLSAALHLRGQGREVVLIEAQRVGWGASGRNGGQVGTGQRVDQMTLEKMVGADHARMLWDLAQDSKAIVRHLVDKHSIACDLKPGIIYADHKKRYTSDTAAYVEHLNKVYGYKDIEFLDGRALRDHLGTEAYYSGSLDWGAGHLHPLNFALGLAKAAAAAGARIYEMTRATAIRHGQTVTVQTEGGEIRARQVLIACNGYLGDLVPELAARVMPINSYIIATEPLSEAEARDVIARDVAVADSRFVVNYFRLSADRRMLFGGRESYTNAASDPADVAESGRKRMLSVYPQLASKRVEYSWGGTIAITMNRMPLFRRVKPNVLAGLGYSGHGVAMATLGGALMAEALCGHPERFDAMAAVPIHRFPGGTRLRQPLLALALMYFATRDRISILP